MTRAPFGTAALLCALLAGACSVPASSPLPEPGTAAAPARTCGRAAALPSARFAVRLLDEASEAGSRNAVLSPLGIEAVLAMAAEGATAPLRRTVARLFTEETNEAWAAWTPACGITAARAAAETDAGVDLAIANGVFADRGLDMFPAFRAALEGRFGATVARLDFADAGAPDEINAWVERETAGAVPHLLDGLDPDDALVLANAVHFRGKWAHAFDPALTKPQSFRLASGETVEAPAMQAEDLPARYREDADFRAVELLYGGGRFVFTAVLPREGLGPAEALARLADDPGWLVGARFRKAAGRLALPRLELEGKAGLLPALRRLGLEEALGDRNAFAGIAAPAPALGRILHAARLTLDERGTEAAAATAAIFATRAAIEEEARFEMTVDRPFALAVRQTDGGGLLFAAWVARPGTER